MTVVDFAPAVKAFAMLALAAAIAGAPYAYLVLRFFHLRLTQHQMAMLTLACDKGAELAYGLMVGQGASLAHVSIKNAALAHGVNHVLVSLPDTLKKLGITPDHVHRMVEARFAGLVAKQVWIAPPAALPLPDQQRPSQDNPALLANATQSRMPMQAAGDPPASAQQAPAFLAGVTTPAARPGFLPLKTGTPQHDA